MEAPPPLDTERVDLFGRRLREQRRKMVRSPELWAAFASAFPHRPSGPSERRLLIAALETLEARGLLRLPAGRGRRWDRKTQPPVPVSIELIRERPQTPSADWRRFPWHPSLQWVLEQTRLSPEQIRFLERVHCGLVNGEFGEPAPLKYRSLQLTGHEKRLADFARSTLFGAGRLTLDLLGCLAEVLPLAWEGVGEGDRMLVFENAGPFTVACRILRTMHAPPYGIVGYGAGRAFIAGLGYIPSIERKVGRIDYVGDLDAAGLDIMMTVSDRALAMGLPFGPATKLHVAMVQAAAAFGATEGWAAEEAKPRGRRVEDLIRPLDPCVASSISEILRRGHRIPEEVLGPREMRSALEG